jgi:RNase H-fold protein (predicted Holliday junction resolvase)
MSAKNERAALAIDPGSAKCGMAVVRQDGIILIRAIVPTDRLLEQTRAWLIDYAPEAILLGAGTGSKSAHKALKQAELPVPVYRVEEAYTSQAARARYVAENAPRGWQRLLPRSLRTPDTPYDDYVAVILAERYWQSQSSTQESPNDAT